MPDLPIDGPKVRHPFVVRRLEVSHVTRVASSMVRITLTGPELDGFIASGPADHVKVFLPDPATGELVIPTTSPDGVRLPTSGTVVARDYTPRDFRPASALHGAELDLDVVVHGVDGPASAWASSAGLGAPLAVGGPRGSRPVPEGIAHLVLVVDETGFPAASRWLRLTPPQVPVTVVLDAAEPADRAYFDDVPGADRATFVVVPRRDGDELERAVRGLGSFDPRGHAFLAGEATRLVPLRRYLRRELALPPARVRVSGYWKRGVVALDHHAPVDPTDPD